MLLRIVACLLTGAVVLAAQAQIAILPVQPLRFGELAGELRTEISPSDSSSRLEVHVVGEGSVTLVFDLPSSLSLRDGIALPLRFGPGDGLVAFPGSSTMVAFDPTVPISFVVPAGSGGARIYLGGAVVAPRHQPPGDYSATITVQALTR